MKTHRLIGILFVFLFVLLPFNNAFSESYEIEEFPDEQEQGYTWYRGCGPTSLSMVLNYHGGHGFPNLYVEPSVFTWSGPDWQDQWWIPDFIEWSLWRYIPRELTDNIINTINNHRPETKYIPTEGQGEYGVSGAELAIAAEETCSIYGYTNFNSQKRTFNYNAIKLEVDKNRPVILGYNVFEEPEKIGVVTITRGGENKDNLKQAIKDQINDDVNYIIEINGVATNGSWPDILLIWEWNTEIWIGATQEYKKTNDYILTNDGYIDWSPTGNEPASGTTYKVACTFHVASGHAIAVFGYDYSENGHTFKYYSTWDTAAETKNWDNFQNYSYISVEPPINIDAALIIDSSGSMTWNDPQDLRKEAAKIFIDTAQNDDQIAIVDFDFYSQTHWSLQPLTENRDNIKSAVNLINSSGGTSLSAGLLEGYDQLDSSTQPYKKAAVFLTDGVGTYNNEADSYKLKGWPIYVIGLGNNTNSSLLQNIADTTGGDYFALTDPDQLQNVYFEIAAQISEGNLLASESSVMSTGDTFSTSVAIPAGQLSASFLTTWPGSDVDTTLTSPSGVEITPTTSDPDIYYAKGLTYELYRATNPEAGDWTMNLYGADLAPQGETVNISVSSIGPPAPQDTTPPVINISNPVSGKTYFDQLPTNFSFMTEDPESAIVSQSALLNGVTINNNDSILLTQLGENTLIITATNEANLTSELSITFYVNRFTWLPPIQYENATETLTYVARANSTLPIKFNRFDDNESFIVDTTVKVVVEGTTGLFTYGEGDTNIRINQEEGEDPLYIVNLHTNFNKCDYGLEAGNEYNLTVYFDDILAARTKLRIE